MEKTDFCFKILPEDSLTPCGKLLRPRRQSNSNHLKELESKQKLTG